MNRNRFDRWVLPTVPAALALGATSVALAIPPDGILHGFVQTQAGVPITEVTATVTLLEGDYPFSGVNQEDRDGDAAAVQVAGEFRQTRPAILVY